MFQCQASLRMEVAFGAFHGPRRLSARLTKQVLHFYISSFSFGLVTLQKTLCCIIQKQTFTVQEAHFPLVCRVYQPVARNSLACIASGRTPLHILLHIYACMNRPHMYKLSNGYRARKTSRGPSVMICESKVQAYISTGKMTKKCRCCGQCVSSADVPFPMRWSWRLSFDYCQVVIFGCNSINSLCTGTTPQEAL